MEQIITEDGQLVTTLEEHIDRIGIQKAGLDYHMIAIIGPQSSGKSTLLNLLFGTTFQTMNEQTGRQQTTKGIHASSAIGHPLLLFDVEGCDSRERGDSDALFERKAALFALALSEVLIINMWESDIGRYNASNIPMLRTVFEVNVQLFLAQQEVKTKILFIIRDFTTNAFEAICQNLKRDMNDIWKEISLPDQFKGRTIEDFFEFEFYTIHHMKIERPKFDEDVERLKGWFMDPGCQDYLFKEKSSKLVPGDGLAHYIRTIWDTIVNNKELNLPSQKSMLSHFRCEENVRSALAQVEDVLEETVVRPIMGKKMLENFKECCQRPVDEAFKTYNENSWRYLPDVVAEKAETLKKELSDFLKPLFTKNCEMRAQQISNDFVDFLNAQGEELDLEKHWSETVSKQEEAFIADLTGFAKSCVVVPFEWTFDTSHLLQQMKSIASMRENNLINSLHETVTASVVHKMETDMNEVIKKSQPEMWEELRKLMADTIAAGKQQVQTILAANVPEDKQTPNGQKITKQVESAALSLVQDTVKFINIKMKAAFDRSFKHDSAGRPRVWTPSDDLDDTFNVSRHRGYEVLRLFTICRLKEAGKRIGSMHGVLIDQEKQEELRETYEREINLELEAARQVISAQAQKNQIPPFAWFLFIVLCGDRVAKFMSNPLVFIVVMFLGGSFFILKQIGLWDLVLERVKESVKETLYRLQNPEDDEEEEAGEEEEKLEDSGPEDRSPERERPVKNEEEKQEGTTQELPDVADMKLYMSGKPGVTPSIFEDIDDNEIEPKPAQESPVRRRKARKRPATKL